MSAYSDQLRNTVLSSLAIADTKVKAGRAANDAAMFTLYYAQAAVITATNKLAEARGELAKKKQLKEQAVAGQSVCGNTLATAGQSHENLKTSVTGAAVNAANVQSAANAIVGLASDIGSIYSIMKAADFDSELYKQVDEIHACINDVASVAEMASLVAMEASMQTSEVSAGTVVAKAKTTHDAIAGTVQVANNECIAAEQWVAERTAQLASAYATEKAAEGNYKNSQVAFNAAGKDYLVANEVLNLGLLVTDPSIEKCTVGFHRIIVPFNAADVVYDPVTAYNIMLVKEAKKSVFNSMQAAVMLLSERQHIAVAHAAPNGKKIKAKQSQLISKEIFFRRVSKDKTVEALQDADGDAIIPGVPYVAFVFAEYAEDYKRKLNNFDNFLSAPSASFSIKNMLASVEGRNIIQDAADPKRLLFKVAENPDYAGGIEYRCILLPKYTGHQVFLNMESTGRLNRELALLEHIAEKYDPEIASCETTMITANARLSQCAAELDAVNKTVKTKNAKTVNDNKGKDSKTGNAATVKNATALKLEMKKINDELARIKTVLTTLVTAKNKAVNKVVNSARKVIAPGFLWNMDIAQQVPAGNYLIARPTPSSDKKGTLKREKKISEKYWSVEIDLDTTDNFGNPLVNGQTYIPVILSVSTAAEACVAGITNGWSGNSQTNEIIYSPR